MKLILASNSAARKSMLTAAGVEFSTLPADVDEDILKRYAISKGVKPVDIAVLLAGAKAESVSIDNPTNIVIGSDQILEVDGQLLSKVDTREAASRQIQRLQGKQHHLHSAVVCYRNGTNLFGHVDTAKLEMWPMTEQQIAKYLREAGDTVLGSVGCYQIEAEGIRLFKTVEGSHFTIMGMPLIPLLGFLRSAKTTEAID